MLAALSAPALADAPATASAAVDDGDPRVELSLLTDHDALEPGQRFQVGVLFRLDPEWHVYFRNPGEAAVGTEVTFASEDARFGPIGWPVPERIVDRSGTITTFGYEDEVLLGAEGRVADDASGAVRVEATADFLVCKVDCIPGRVTLSRTLPLGSAGGATPSEEHARFEAHRAALPETPDEAGVQVELALEQALRPNEQVRAALSVVTCDGPRDGCATPGAPAAGVASAFFPDRVAGLSVEATEVRAHPSAFAGAVVELRLKASPDDPGSAQTLSGLLVLETDDGPLALEVSGEVPRARAGEAVTSSESPLFGAEAGEAGEVVQAVQAEEAPLPGLFTMLLLALLGGIILNAMPCVLPVLALKAFGLAQMAGEGRAARVAHTGAYTAGVTAAMWALAATVVGLRAAGTEVGWGFQLQEPWFATVLSALLVVFALGLFGLFEIGVDATRLSAQVDGAHGLPRSFGEGVLAVVLATPCSAPFLGTAIGFAFASDALTIFAIFTAVAVGLAAPFALIALFPGAQRLLPRPGAWMQRMQVLLGFALLGTAVWLAWVVGQVAGVDGMTRLIAFLLLTGAATWAFVEGRKGGRWIRWVVPGLALGLVLYAGAWTLQSASSSSVRRLMPVDAGPWSPEMVQTHLADGRPVFVDFTAAWCITCKVNERVVLGSDTVKRAFAENGVALLIGDWTERDEAIRAELARYGKAGVPLYLMFSPSAPDAPEVLPELLTEALVLDAIARAQGDTR